MKFYEITADLLAGDSPIDDKARRKLTDNIREISKQFCYENNENLYFFVSQINNDSLTAGLIVSDSEYNVDGIIFPWEKMKLKVNHAKVGEICSAAFVDLLNDGFNNDYSDSPRHVIMRFGLRKICTSDDGLLSESVAYAEKMIDDSLSSDKMRDLSRTLLWDTSIVPELERIEARAKIEGVEGHPIHYIFYSDDYDNRQEMVYTMLSSLYRNKRLQIKRSCSLSLSNLDSREIAHLDTLYECYSGGAIIIRYNKSAAEEACAAGADIETIENVCDVIKANRNRVLTVLCFPSSCSKEKEQFFTYLENMTFLTLKESDVDKIRAAEYLKNKAEINKCPTYDSLIERITDERQYRISELNRIFAEWMENYIKTDVYPQYRDILSVKTEYAAQKPVGNAYNKLQRMVGLGEVKCVIDSALDYFKAQKIFKAKGAFCQNPSMHMVFMGNPGTAKTTVARLFAEILRDNDVLSSGHLVEVGRSDLVGKYVGWTARMVKDKFQEAKGGVLFIDEAYSLVDDRAGSFGDEAINTVVQEMENSCGDLVVVFAGYPDKMSGFLDKNPGLRSRIAFHVQFNDYTPDELCCIAKLMSENKNLRLESEAISKIHGIFAEAVKQSDFGNGRYVRNLLEKATMRQATRLVRGESAEALDEADIFTLLSDDFVSEKFPMTEKEKHRIGFCA